MNDTARTHALEQALQQCIGYLQALPPHPMTRRTIAAAQAALDAASCAQPRRAEVRHGDVLLLAAMLHADGRHLTLYTGADGHAHDELVALWSALRFGGPLTLAELLDGNSASHNLSYVK